jgi:carbon-monoxide dehydrogenase medium subunit
MQSFEFHKPTSIADAVALLEARGEAKLLAGGQSLLPVLKLGLAAPSDLISLAGIPGLAEIRVDGGKVAIGASCTHDQVHRSADVARAIPALAALAGGIGDQQVRNRGTLGGSVAHADPAADYPAAVLALKATIVTDRRQLAGDGYFTGLFETALEPAEVITAVHFLAPKRAGYVKFGHKASKYAVVGVFVADFGGGDVRVAVTGAAAFAFRVPAFEQALAGKWSADALAGLTVPAGDLMSDPDHSAEYRAHLVGVMARRAVAAAG